MRCGVYCGLRAPLEKQAASNKDREDCRGHLVEPAREEIPNAKLT
jgi:hypothetical protein